MENLLVLDRKNYSSDLKVTERFCARAIIVKDGRIAVQQSAAGDFKLLGGGKEPGEPIEVTLEREVREESGLLIIPESIVPIGEIIEKRLDIFDDQTIYVCHTEFYRCEIREETVEVNMTDSEIAKGFHPAWVSPEDFIHGNGLFMFQPWTYRDTKFVQMCLLK